jgi:hypothetical protein
MKEHSMIRTSLMAAVLLAAMPLQHAGAQDAAPKAHYKFKNVKDGKQETAVSSINNAGVATVGYFAALGDVRNCYTLQGKTKTKLSDPNGVNGTECWDINNTGSIVGDYVDANDAYHGYIYDIAKTTFTDIAPPGSISTVAYGVNDSNVVIGYYLDKKGNSHGFIYDGSKYTVINIKGGTDTEGFGINNAGDYTVTTVLADSLEHSYLFSGGKKTEIKFKGYTQVAAHHINSKGVLCATLIDSNSVYHGGVFDSVTGKHYVVDDPMAHDTVMDGINDKDSLAGRYDTSSGGASIGYIATGKLD